MRCSPHSGERIRRKVFVLRVVGLTISTNAGAVSRGYAANWLDVAEIAGNATAFKTKAQKTYLNSGIKHKHQQTNTLISVCF